MEVIVYLILAFIVVVGILVFGLIPIFTALTKSPATGVLFGLLCFFIMFMGILISLDTIAVDYIDECWSAYDIHLLNGSIIYNAGSINGDGNVSYGQIDYSIKKTVCGSRQEHLISVPEFSRPKG